MTSEIYSSLGFKFCTSTRNGAIKCGKEWLNEKGKHDGADGLWRIHDGIYDFTDFIDKHPGGRDWLIVTQGTDITEAFEAHHISIKAENMLKSYFKQSARTSRNSPYTFHKNGFYRTLKANVRNELNKIPRNPIKLTKIYTDGLMALTFMASLLTVHCDSHILGIVASYFFSSCAVAAHNFFHMRDNFRMYYFDLTPMRSREWRIIHVLSHHLYPNTLIDLEISMLEPWFQWLPHSKPFINRYGPWLYFPFSYAIMFFGIFYQRFYLILKDGKGANAFTVQDLIQFSLPLFMFAFGGKSLLVVLYWWLFILMATSFIYYFVGLNAAHHDPILFHDGDTPRPTEERDWGIMQLDSVMDRRDITGSHFLVLTNFGDHGLHHLFPILDHGQLQFLYPVFEKTCETFGIKLKMKTQIELIIGQFKQLANNVPNPFPPGRIK